ncbi:hypothetical protein BSKO_01661 [Bryopsis sp. KO-2023]|nr:hypothetical protein BSKO_01661 [Bryopsis sp. KO-2023]
MGDSADGSGLNHGEAPVESVQPWTQNLGEVAPSMLEEDVVCDISLPHYALPSISSLLPEYANSEQDIIHRTFHKGNYDMLRSLPDVIHEHEVIRARMSRICGLHIYNGTKNPPNARKKSCVGKSTDPQGLFQAFNYIPSKYSLVDELQSKDRAESEAKRMQISGQDFQRVGTIVKGKYEDEFEPGVPYPYLSDPYEAMEEKQLLETWKTRSQILHGPFYSSGHSKLSDGPTKAMQEEVMVKLKQKILEDWEGAEMLIYPNDDGLWVMRFCLSSVESEMGLVAYMNIFIRCSTFVNKYNLVKVVENWCVKPGDGCIYFTVRPSWVHCERAESFFTLHPEERSFKTIQAFRTLMSRHEKK